MAEDIAPRVVGEMLRKMSAEYSELAKAFDRDDPMPSLDLNSLRNRVQDLGNRNQSISALIGRMLRFAQVQQR